MDPLVGKVFEGRYRITALLGEGRSSTVYAAEELAARRQVALRLLHFQAPCEPYVALRHENVITTFTAGQTPDGLVFLTAELIRAPRLHQLLRDGGALPWQRALEIVVQLCNAQHAANRAGIAGPLTPEKIYLEPFDVVRVDVSPHLPGVTMGPYETSNAVKNIGVLAHEMLTGELPPLSGDEDPPKLPAELEAIVVGCRRNDFAYVREVRDALLAVRAAIRPAAAT